MKTWTSIKAVYLLMSIVLFTAIAFHNWYIVLFVITMLQIGVWTGFCPSKWIFEKLGFKKSDL
jgi:general stress protein CsbA